MEEDGKTAIDRWIYRLEGDTLRKVVAGSPIVWLNPKSDKQFSASCVLPVAEEAGPWYANGQSGSVSTECDCGFDSHLGPHVWLGRQWADHPCGMLRVRLPPEPPSSFASVLRTLQIANSDVNFNKVEILVHQETSMKFL